MFPQNVRAAATDNLVELVEKSNYCIGTGFPGTPHILFVLADNGYADVAYKMLLNTRCPSWLYEVRVGATTIWERWDGLDENGQCPIGDDGTDNMISYNHYASGRWAHSCTAGCWASSRWKRATAASALHRCRAGT